jgi:hypothetical protein
MIQVWEVDVKHSYYLHCSGIQGIRQMAECWLHDNKYCRVVRVKQSAQPSLLPMCSRRRKFHYHLFHENKVP